MTNADIDAMLRGETEVRVSGGGVGDGDGNSAGDGGSGGGGGGGRSQATQDTIEELMDEIDPYSMASVARAVGVGVRGWCEQEAPPPCVA